MTDPKSQQATADAYTEAERLAQAGDWNAAEGLFTRVGEEGDARGWLALARHCCEEAHADLPRAAGYFERAAELGSPDGALQAAYMFHTGSAGEKDPARALRYFEQSADAGGCISATRAGFIHYLGEAGAPDPVRAVALFERAVAIDEEPEAMLGLGRAYSEGKLPRDVTKAVHYFRRATLESETLGDRASSESRRAMFTSWAQEGARGVHGLIDALAERAEGGDADACFELAQVHRQRFVDEANDDTALHWLTRAAEAAHGEALLQLAHRYRTGDGVDLDAKKARSLMERAAATNHSAAHHDLAYALLSGLGGPSDMERAITHYRQAAGLGRRNSMYDLAIQLHERAANGDDAECTDWLRRGAEKGDVASMLWLAQRCRDGEGTAVDLVEATRWFFRPLVFGNGDGMHEIHGYIKKMSPEQVREAARLADVAPSWAESAIATFLR